MLVVRGTVILVTIMFNSVDVVYSMKVVFYEFLRAGSSRFRVSKHYYGMSVAILLGVHETLELAISVTTNMILTQ